MAKIETAIDWLRRSGFHADKRWPELDNVVELNGVGRRNRSGSGVALAERYSKWTHRHLDENRIPDADLQLLQLACAQYAPFHDYGADVFGIYMDADAVLRYADQVAARSRALATNPTLLLTYCLYEAFQRRFHDHVVESGVLTCEVILAASSHARSLWQNKSTHADLAARVYAFNSQYHLKAVREGPGELIRFVISRYMNPYVYKKSEHQLVVQRNCGPILAAHLLTPPDECGLLDYVGVGALMHGHSTVTRKPDIPLYLHGSAEATATLQCEVADLRRACTSFYLPGNSTHFEEAVAMAGWPTSFRQPVEGQADA